LALCLAAPAQAQLKGNAVWGTAPGPGVMIAGDFATGVNDDVDGQQYFGVRAALGLPMFSVWAGGGLARANTNADREVTFGGGIGVTLLSVPFVTVGGEVGVGFVNQQGIQLADATIGDVTDITIPVGVRIGLKVPSPMIGIRPFLTPRVQVQMANDGTNSTTEFGFGATLGLELSLPVGPGLHVAADFASITDAVTSVTNPPTGPTDLGTTPFTLSIGLHHRISVPSLGVPMM
jgi:hypothetical protein